MRRKKNRSRLLPFGAGLAAGYLLTIGVAAAGALVAAQEQVGGI